MFRLVKGGISVNIVCIISNTEFFEEPNEALSLVVNKKQFDCLMEIAEYNNLCLAADFTPIMEIDNSGGKVGD